MKWDKGQSDDLVEDRRKKRRRRSSPPPRSERSSPPPRPSRKSGKSGKSGGSKVRPAVLAALIVVSAAIAAITNSVRDSDEGEATSADEAEVTTEPETTETAETAEAPEPPQTAEAGDAVTGDRELVDFLTFLVNDTNAFWKKTFEGEHRLRYKPAKLVIFDGLTRSKCGPRRARGGPAYCPNDQIMYVPPAFFVELRARHDAPGDFAQALVVAHEMGHHAQLGLGVTKAVHAKKKGTRSRSGKLRWKRKQELQADCLAGVWAHDVERRGRLESGDAEEAFTAIAAIGDDALQQAAGKKIDRSRWGHGSSAQRLRYFKKGFRRGRLKDCLRELESPYIK